MPVKAVAIYRYIQLYDSVLKQYSIKFHKCYMSEQVRLLIYRKAKGLLKLYYRFLLSISGFAKEQSTFFGHRITRIWCNRWSKANFNFGQSTCHSYRFSIDAKNVFCLESFVEKRLGQCLRPMVLNTQLNSRCTRLGKIASTNETK